MTRYIYQYLSSFTRYPLHTYIPYSHIRPLSLLTAPCMCQSLSNCTCFSRSLLSQSTFPACRHMCHNFPGANSFITAILIHPSHIFVSSFYTLLPIYIRISLVAYASSGPYSHVPVRFFRRLPHILLLIYIVISPAMHASSPSLKNP